MGWGITTPLCLLTKAELLEDVQIHPLTRGQFSRHFDLLSRENSLGQVPAKIADEARRILRTECMPPLYDRIPWIEEKFNWNLDGEDNSAN